MNKKKPNGVPGKSLEVRGRNKVNEAADGAINSFVQNTVQLGIEGLKKEFSEVKNYMPADASCAKFQENEPRNRYKGRIKQNFPFIIACFPDVVCLDATRVVLTLNVPPESDYIHANWIKLDGVDRQYIAAQAPLENTVSDFWR